MRYKVPERARSGSRLFQAPNSREIRVNDPILEITSAIVINLADLTIVDGDFFSTPASDLWKEKVRMTVVGGRVVYKP